MAKYRDNFPHLSGDLFLIYCGMETDLMFNRGIDLPGFASYPLLETQTGRELLEGYLKDMIDLARDAGTGVILESPTWVANRDRARALGYGPDQLAALNQQAIALKAKVRRAYGDVPTVLSANVGPREDAYAPDVQMSVTEAEAYHSQQISALAQTEADVISGYTIAYVAEAIGIVRAARRLNLPVVIPFTVETDGQLPTGCALRDAIAQVDTATQGYAAYFMINCAHPDHFAAILEQDGAWMARLKGVVVNASRCSHAQLDQAEALDPGDPKELGEQLAQLRRQHRGLRMLGGCCGTDMRHMAQIARATGTALVEQGGADWV